MTMDSRNPLHLIAVTDFPEVVIAGRIKQIQGKPGTTGDNEI